MSLASSLPDRRQTLFLAAIGCLAFLLRLTAGLARGPEFVDAGYAFYAEIARTFWDGGGLCAAPGVECAVRVPLYPVLVAPFLAAGTAYPWLIVFQSLVGATLPLLAYGIGAELFGTRAGTLAAIATAVNPYAVLHGPTFQDTVVFNALIALSVYLLIRAARGADHRLYAAAGLALALATMTTVRMALFVPVAIAWAAGAGVDRSWRGRGLRAALVAIPVALLVGGWMARNARLVGVPVLTTEAGLSLWLAHNDATMEILPNRSIDEVETRAWLQLTRDQRQMAEMLAHAPVEQDRFFGGLGVDYIVDHPVATVTRAVIKVAVNFCGWLTPARSWPAQLGYMLLFLPVNVLALAGLWRARNAGGAHLLVLLLFVTFATTTAIFWAHTSHRSFLHVFKFVFAASLITGVPGVRTVPEGA